MSEALVAPFPWFGGTREEAERAVAAWLKTHTVTVCPPPAPIVGTPNAGASWRHADRVA